MSNARGLSSIGNSPAISVYQSVAQTFTTGTFTKVQLQTESYDTHGAFDSTTNYRFTPTVPGYYLVTALVHFAANATGIRLAAVYKNGSIFRRGVNSPGFSADWSSSSVSCVVYLNGTTDYMELFAYQGSGGNLATIASGDTTYLQAHLIRGT